MVIPIIKNSCEGFLQTKRKTDTYFCVLISKDGRGVFSLVRAAISSR
jgi:hypothetical protein